MAALGMQTDEWRNDLFTEEIGGGEMILDSNKLAHLIFAYVIGEDVTMDFETVGIILKAALDSSYNEGLEAAAQLFDLDGSRHRAASISQFEEIKRR